MGVLSSKLVVSLIDRTGAGSRSVLRNVATIKAANTGLGAAMNQTTQILRRQSRTMRAFRTLGGGGAGMAGLGATALAGGFLASELKYQEAMNRTKAILNITSKKGFKPHRDLVIDLAKRYPTTSAEIAKGASELAMAGMSLKEVNAVLEATVQGSMASGESIKTVGQGVTDVVMGLGQALTKGNFLNVNNVLAAAATSYAQDYRQFLDGLAKTAPLARMLNMPLDKLSATLGILADAGFKGAKGGTALRTSMINLAAPPKKALAFLQQAGVDITKFQKKVDTFQLTGKSGAKSLSGFLADSLNADVSGANLENVLTPILSNKKLLKNIPMLKRRLGRAIASALNISNGQDSKLVGEAVSRFVQSGFKQLNVMGLMRELAAKGFDENTGAMKELFGKRFVAQMASVLNSLRDGTFDKKMNGVFLPRIEGAVKRFAKILMEGLPGALKRLGGAFDAFARSLASSGAIDTVVNVFGSLTRGINQLSQTNPAALKAITLALLGIGVIAPLGFALQGIAASVTLINSAAAIAAVGVRALAGALVIAPFAAASGTRSAAAAGMGLLATRAKAARTAVASMMMLSSVGGAKAVAGAAAGSAFLGIGRGLLSIAKVAGRLTVVGAAVTALVGAFKFIKNNWDGIGTALTGIGEGFMSNLGPAKPIVIGIAGGLKKIFSWLDKVTGPLDASKEKWKSWGHAIGKAIAWPIRKIGKLISKIQEWGSYLTDNAVGRWIGRRMGFDGKQPNDPGGLGAKDTPARKPLGKMVAQAANVAPKPAAATPAGSTGKIAAVKAEAQGAVTTVSQAMSQIQSIAGGVDLTSSGRKIMVSLATGMRSAMGEPIAAMRDTAQRIKNHVPNSPAKEGPLRGIHRHGLMSEIARGIRNDRSLASAMDAAAARARMAVDNMRGHQQLAMAGASGAGAGSGGSHSIGAITVHVNVPTGVGSADEVGEAVGRRVQDAVRETYSDGGF